MKPNPLLNGAASEQAHSNTLEVFTVIPDFLVQRDLEEPQQQVLLPVVSAVVEQGQNNVTEEPVCPPLRQTEDQPGQIPDTQHQASKKQTV